METIPNEQQTLQTTLDHLGSTPAQARALIDAARATHGGDDAPGVVATLHEFLRATDRLGKTAHEVLGHVPDAATPKAPTTDAPAPPPLPEADRLLTRLAFLREHIVSTIDVQGAAVWESITADGRPLRAYAEDLAHADRELLARLGEVTGG